MRTLGVVFLTASCLFGAERMVDPTFLHRYVPDVQAQASDGNLPLQAHIR